MEIHNSKLENWKFAIQILKFNIQNLEFKLKSLNQNAKSKIFNVITISIFKFKIPKFTMENSKMKIGNRQFYIKKTKNQDQNSKN